MSPAPAGRNSPARRQAGGGAGPRPCRADTLNPAACASPPESPPALPDPSQITYCPGSLQGRHLQPSSPHRRRRRSPPVIIAPPSKSKQPSNLTNPFELLIIICRYQSDCSCKINNSNKEAPGEPYFSYQTGSSIWVLLHRLHPGKMTTTQDPTRSATFKHGEEPRGHPSVCGTGDMPPLQHLSFTCRSPARSLGAREAPPKVPHLDPGRSQLLTKG